MWRKGIKALRARRLRKTIWPAHASRQRESSAVRCRFPYAHRVLHRTRLLWLNGFTGLEIISGSLQPVCTGRVHFITTTGLWEHRNRRNIEKGLTRSTGLYRLLSYDSTLMLSSTRSGRAFERCRKEARDPERAGESLAPGATIASRCAARRALMALRAYQESQVGQPAFCC